MNAEAELPPAIDEGVADVDPRARRLWFVVGSVVAVVMLAFGVTSAIGLVAREERTVTHKFDPRDLAVVEVTSNNGDVRVIGDSDTVVRVVIRISEGLGGIDEVARAEGERLVLSSTCPEFWSTFCEARYEVHVPPTLTVVARSENGDAVVSGVDAGSTIESSNGAVTGERLGGQVRMTTENGDALATAFEGDVLAVDSRNGDVEVDVVRPPNAVTARSDNGDVVVRIPRGDELYAVSATTDNGEATTPVRTDPGAERRIIAESDNGDVTVRYR